MNELVVADRASEWRRLKALVLDSVSSPITRRVYNRGDQVCGDQMSEKVVWQMLKTYVAGAGLPDIAPHDLRRYAESRTMPSRFEESSFGVKLIAKPDQLI